MLAYDRTDVLLITFSVRNRASFRNVKDLWLKEVEKNKDKFRNARVRIVHTPNQNIDIFIILRSKLTSFQIVLVGTKSDLRGDANAKRNTEDKDITKAEAEQLAKEIKATCYMETSAKTGDGIKELFLESIKAAMSEGKSSKKFCVLL